jgi:deoxyribonuclease V
LTEPPPKASPSEETVSTSELFSFENAIIAQEKFSRLVKKQSILPRKILRVAGVDVAYAKQLSFTAAVLLDFKTLKSIEVQLARNIVKVPYRPGFLGFREAAVMVEAVEKLNTKPDLVLVDGHGLAHPRGFGLACHVGVMLDLPTIGIAKNLFYGEVHRDQILDKGGHDIGAIINAKKKMLYVSIGHKVSLNAAIRIVRHCTISDVPEPLRLAHQEATRMARKMKA